MCISAAEVEQAARAGQLETAAAAIAKLHREIDCCLAYLPAAREAVAGAVAG